MTKSARRAWAYKASKSSLSGNRNDVREEVQEPADHIDPGVDFFSVGKDVEQLLEHFGVYSVIARVRTQLADDGATRLTVRMFTPQRVDYDVGIKQLHLSTSSSSESMISLRRPLSNSDFSCSQSAPKSISWPVSHWTAS